MIVLRSQHRLALQAGLRNGRQLQFHIHFHQVCRLLAPSVHRHYHVSHRPSGELLLDGNQILDDSLLGQVSHVGVGRLDTHDFGTQETLDVEGCQIFDQLEHLERLLRGGIRLCEVRVGHNFDWLANGKGLQADRCSGGQACDRVRVDLDAGAVAEKSIFAGQFEFGEELVVQVVLDEEDRVAQTHQFAVLGARPFALGLLHLDGACLLELGPPDYLETVGRVDRRDYHFWHVALPTAETAMQVWTRHEIFLALALSSAIGLLGVFDLFARNHQMAEFAGLSIQVFQLVGYHGHFCMLITAMVRGFVRAAPIIVHPQMVCLFVEDGRAFDRLLALDLGLSMGRREFRVYARTGTSY